MIGTQPRPIADCRPAREGHAPSWPTALAGGTPLVTRDLKLAVEGGLLSVSAEGPDGIYAYIPPADPITRRIVELSV